MAVTANPVHDLRSGGKPGTARLAVEAARRERPADFADDRPLAAARSIPSGKLVDEPTHAYIVQTCDFEGTTIWGVFATADDARACLARLRASCDEDDWGCRQRPPLPSTSSPKIQ
jgi:hypothetical protein